MTEEQPYGQALQSSDSTAQPKPLGELAQQHIATAPHLNQGTHLEGNWTRDLEEYSQSLLSAEPLG